VLEPEVVYPIQKILFDKEVQQWLVCFGWGHTGTISDTNYIDNSINACYMCYVLTTQAAYQIYRRVTMPDHHYHARVIPIRACQHRNPGPPPPRTRLYALRGLSWREKHYLAAVLHVQRGMFSEVCL
jgi:hypothetical protein